MSRTHLQTITRREFAARLSFGAAAIPLASIPAAALAAQEETSKADATPKQEPEDAGQKSPESQPPAQADLLVEVVRLRYSDERLTDEVLEHIRGEIQADMFRAAVLRRFPLRNTDAPAFVFSAYRAD